MSQEPDTDPVTITIRRNALLSGVVGGLALLLGLAYLVRGSSFFDSLVGVLLLAVGVLNLPALVTARVPVLVVDGQGIRFRIGLVWRGLPWGDVRQVVVEPADSMLGEGRLVVVPHGPVTALDEAGTITRAHLRWNEYWYGAPISLPLGLSTMTETPDLAAELTVLAGGRTEVVSTYDVEPEPAHLDELPVPVEEPFAEPAVVLPAAVLPLRDLHSPARVEVRLDEPADALVDTFDNALPAWDHETPIEILLDDELRDAHAGDELTEVVSLHGFDELPVTKPEPLIGLKILHAREMLDMSIDELSQRTRIRPHVLEAIEEDDFAPCGGDFYARGHLTAIARVLGLTLEPLMKIYDETYAQAPINARRVFEAELATGLSGGMRATLGGPRWSLVIGAVLSLTMIWGLARMFAGDPEQLTAAPDPSSQVAGLAANRTPITSPRMKTSPMTVTAAHAATHVVVRDRTNKVLWSGDLAMGRHRKIVGLAPFKVSADNAGAIEVSVKGQALGTIGTAGAAGSKTFG